MFNDNFYNISLVSKKYYSLIKTNSVYLDLVTENISQNIDQFETLDDDIKSEVANRLLYKDNLEINYEYFKEYITEIRSYQNLPQLKETFHELIPLINRNRLCEIVNIKKFAFIKLHRYFKITYEEAIELSMDAFKHYNTKLAIHLDNFYGEWFASKTFGMKVDMIQKRFNKIKNSL